MREGAPPNKGKPRENQGKPRETEGKGKPREPRETKETKENPFNQQKKYLPINGSIFNQ